MGKETIYVCSKCNKSGDKKPKCDCNAPIYAQISSDKLRGHANFLNGAGNKVGK